LRSELETESGREEKGKRWGKGKEVSKKGGRARKGNVNVPSVSTVSVHRASTGRVVLSNDVVAASFVEERVLAALVLGGDDVPSSGRSVRVELDESALEVTALALVRSVGAPRPDLRKRAKE
jgi:hypothetical protein